MKVITSNEMQKIERIAIERESSDLEFMKKAAEGIAQYIIDLNISKKVVLLLGRGNNAGDALAAALILLKKGFSIRAYCLFSLSLGSDLFKTHLELYKKEDGKIDVPSSSKDIYFEKNEIILDGIFGTGFKNKIDKEVLQIIKKINSFPNIKISIDIPSGLNGNTGKVITTAIKADKTLFLALPKIGFFINEGWNYVGEIIKIDFGLKKEFLDLAKEKMVIFEERDILNWIPVIKRTRNKYEAGYVVGISGSKGMEGAAALTGLASLRSGAGIVKIYLNKGDFSILPREIVKFDLDFKNSEEIIKILNKANSIFIGPGIGRDEEIEKFLYQILPKIHVPCVLDADALFFFSNNLKCLLPKNVIMTPHKGEMLRILQKETLSDEELVLECKNFCKKFNVHLILKGGPTFIFFPNEIPIVVLRGTPGLATAGTGDVLTGIIAAMLSQGLDLKKAALLSTFIHGYTSERVAKEKTSYSMIASDLINSLFKTFKDIKENNIF
ncbi:MAG: hypothetical protein AMS24_03715 [Chlamydiae bacterium SM23_39]|nr:MAG: hypothetical protein AMS24_03715 [Chlamydiae bacterium SM23_39]